MNYKVTFFKLTKEEGTKKGETFVTETKYLGSVIVDDTCVGPNLTIVSKAFRRANDVCLLADKVTVEKV